MNSTAPLTGLQIALKTASVIASMFPGVSLAAIPLAALADHEPELANAIEGFGNLKHVSLAELIAEENAPIMVDDVARDTADAPPEVVSPVQ